MISRSDERPLIVAVEPDAAALERLTHELQRYERDYRVVCSASTEDALDQLEGLRREGGRVAIVLAARGSGGITGEELLAAIARVRANAAVGQ